MIRKNGRGGGRGEGQGRIGVDGRGGSRMIRRTGGGGQGRIGVGAGDGPE